MTLKSKTVTGLTWSFVDNFARQGITFVVGIILARLLSPREFGLIGMTTIFIALSQTLIDSGFTQALIRKQNCKQIDYSTVFYFNLVVGILFYLLLFSSAGTISRFFNEPQLKLIVQVLGLGLIIDAFTIIQRARLTKQINFKLQTKVSVLASIGSGTVGIIMAYRGYGVWSLVMKTLTGVALTSLLLWLWNQWKPSLEFSWNSFKEMFSFGSKLLLSGLIYTAFQNVYLLIIGKYFSATDLGFYSRADQFNTVVSSNITGVIQRVSYPVLSSIQNDKHRLKAAYQKLIKSIMLITFLSMIGLAAIAKPLVLTLVGKQWLPSVIYLQLLCFVGMFFPLHAINLDMLKVQGRSDLFLKLEIIKTIMTVPVVVIAVFLGIKIMIVGMIFVTILAYFLNSYYSGMYLGYSSIQQLKDILPSFFLAVFVGSIVFVSGILLKTSPLVTLIIQVLIGILLTICIVEFLKTEDYIFIKQIIIDKFFKEK